MFSRLQAKEFLKDFKIKTFSHLEETRVFKDPTHNQYYLKLMPHYYNKVDDLSNESMLLIENVESNIIK